MRDEPGELVNNSGKFVALRGRNPLQPQPLGRKTDESHQVLHHPYPFGRDKIAFSVMALPDVAPGDEDTVCTFLKGLEYEMGGYTAAAHDANGQDLCLVFQPLRTREVSACVASPVAAESNNDRFEF